MKTFIFADKTKFNTLYEKFFAGRVFHRIDDQNNLLIKFITKNIENELIQLDFVKCELTEIK